MTYLLDTDTCVHILRGKAKVVHQMQHRSPAELAVSAITHYELLYGVARCPASWRKREEKKVLMLLGHITILPFTADTSAQAAGVRAKLESNGHSIGPMDVLIAATALEYGLTLVTGNLGEFQRVAGLKCESWDETQAV